MKYIKPQKYKNIMKKFKLLKTLLVLIGILIGSVSTQLWATDYYILGPDNSWDQNATHKMVSSGISNWIYKDLTVSGQWYGFKVREYNSTYHGKDANSNCVPGTSYHTGNGDNMYCDFKTSGLTYYFFYNTSTQYLMIQPKYYLGLEIAEHPIKVGDKLKMHPLMMLRTDISSGALVR